MIISRDPAPPPAAYVATSGGLFRDMTIHDFDMARYFLGEVVEVTATGANLISSRDRRARATSTLPSSCCAAHGGALCSITNSPALRVRLRPAARGVRRAAAC